MNKQVIFLSTILLLSSCGETKTNQQTGVAKNTEAKVDSTKFVSNTAKIESKTKLDLPEWVLKSKLINEQILNRNYKIEDRLNTSFLEADFNGDENLDIAIPIADVKTNKKGFAIIHGKTMEVFILGAGKIFKNALGDDQDYINTWKINTKKENEPGVEEESGNGANGILILENPSVEIEASEVGGGQIYWNGKEYAYFHQTC